MAGADNEPSPPLKISTQEFANEIQRDLPDLIKRFPQGISISNLQEEYGESTARIKTVISILLQHHHIQQTQAASRMYYIYPRDYKIDTPLHNLTELQRSICFFLLDIVKKNPPATAVKTNYTYLARHVECSNGGIKSAILRLASLGYISITSPSQRGLSSQLTIQLLQPLLDLNLDT